MCAEFSPVFEWIDVMEAFDKIRNNNNFELSILVYLKKQFFQKLRATNIYWYID